MNDNRFDDIFDDDHPKIRMELKIGKDREIIKKSVISPSIPPIKRDRTPPINNPVMQKGPAGVEPNFQNFNNETPINVVPKPKQERMIHKTSSNPENNFIYPSKPFSDGWSPSQICWDPIQPFAQHTPPSFILENLPPEFAKFCHEAAQELKVPPGQVFASALGTFFCAIQGALEIKRKKRFKVRVSACIIVSIVSGGKKTPTFNICIEALKEWLRDTPESRLVIIDDVTPESFAAALNEGPAALMMDEGARYEQLISNTKKNDILFKALGGNSITVRRATKDDIVVERPVANVFVMLQPKRLQNIATRYNSKEYGVMARALLMEVGESYVYPDLNDDYEISEKSEEWYRNTVFRLANIGHSFATKKHDVGILNLSLESKDLWSKWATAADAAKYIGGELENYPEWASKAPSHLLSLAGILHVVKNESPLASPISLQTMEQAVYLIEYFRDNMICIYDKIGTNPDIQCAMAILDKIKRSYMQTFQKVQFTKSMQGRYKANDINNALALLQSHNYLRIVPNILTGKAGRPFSDKIYVNPNIYNTW